jgi:signal transduction histidine kinase
LSLAAPQKVLFRYHLEGRDTTWQEPGIRRQAFYSDLRPGTYRFRVIASNNDGVWNERGASLDLVIAPAWYQTTGFLALCSAAAVTLVWTAYRLRMRQMATALKLRFDERLSERTRMARDLHDTLLQTIQGTKMVADTALNRPDDGAAMTQAMRQVSTWLGQAGLEARTVVKALRNSTAERNDLVAALQHAIDECGSQRSMDASLTVTGTAREMHPVVRDEVYRIAYEAIRNACTHSAGRSVKVDVAYTHDLEIRVADDGVGIDAAIAEQGRPEHFGLPGMRERAARIGARLAIVTARGAGTEIVLTVPGRVIFQKAAPPWRRLTARLKRIPTE